MITEALKDKVKSLDWYHKIDLGDGLVTPGYDFDLLWDQILQRLDTVDFQGKSVLDIGSWDGKWAFEAERRGASEVWASDVTSMRPVSGGRTETFDVAKEILGSDCQYQEASIYNCDEVFGERRFDIVQCFGVLYHLRYPLLGLAKLRKVLKDGGQLIMETAVLLDTDDSIIQTDFAKIYSLDRSTWNAFSQKALCDAVHDSYFDVKEYSILRRQDEELKVGRGYVSAVATRGVRQHHFFPYPELEAFFEPIA